MDLDAGDLHCYAKRTRRVSLATLQHPIYRSDSIRQSRIAFAFASSRQPSMHAGRQGLPLIQVL